MKLLFVCILLVAITVDSGLSGSPNDPAPPSTGSTSPPRPPPTFGVQRGAPAKPYLQDLAKQGRCHLHHCCARFVYVERVYNWPTKEWCYLCPPIFNSYCLHENSWCRWCRWGDWWCIGGHCTTWYWYEYHGAWCWNRWQYRWYSRRIWLRRVNCVCTPYNWYLARQAIQRRPAKPHVARRPSIDRPSKA